MVLLSLLIFKTSETRIIHVLAGHALFLLSIGRTRFANKCIALRVVRCSYRVLVLRHRMIVG